jgi:hypothetical protein
MPEVAWKGMGDMRARERSGALPPPEFPRAACNEHAQRASKQIATVGSDLLLRQLEAQCELPPSLSRPFGNLQCERMPAGSRLALVVGGEARPARSASRVAGHSYPRAGVF